MSQSSLLLLLLIFCCCSAYMRKEAANSGLFFKHLVGTTNQDSAKFSRHAESNGAVEYEAHLNKTVSSGNRKLIAGLFGSNFKLNVCGKEFTPEKLIAIFVKNGSNYSFKVKSWKDNGETAEVKFDVFIHTTPRFPIEATVSKPGLELIYGAIKPCHPKKEKYSEAEFNLISE
ncbi:unnamed protein product [Caenorhabditis brenneri]